MKQLCAAMKLDLYNFGDATWMSLLSLERGWFLCFSCFADANPKRGTAYTLEHVMRPQSGNLKKHMTDF